MTNIRQKIHNDLTNRSIKPTTILEIDQKALTLLIPLIKAYMDARAKYNRSSSIKNGSEMQEARNAVKSGYDNIYNHLLDRQANEWKDIITQRELMDMIEAEFRNISNEDNTI